MLDFVNTKKALRYSVRPVKGFSCAVWNRTGQFSCLPDPFRDFWSPTEKFWTLIGPLKAVTSIDFPVNTSRRRKSNDNTTFIPHLRVWSEFSNNDYCCSIGVRSGKHFLTSTTIVIRSFKRIFLMYFVRICTCSAAYMPCRQVMSFDVRHWCALRVSASV